MTSRPDWFDADLYPFDSHWTTVGGATVHHTDVGDGPPLLMIHGQPTWSFLYRKMIAGLSDTFRCIAVDLPGFGLSTAPDGYGFTAREHSEVVEGLVEALDLRDIVLVGQDWGGPIGMGVATRQPDRFQAFILGNTWAWVMPAERRIRMFSRTLGTGFTGNLLSKRLHVFTNVFMKRGMRRTSPSKADMVMWRGPHPTPESREPVEVFPRELLDAEPFLAEIEAALEGVADKPALLFHADKDLAFGWREAKRWQEVFPDHRFHVLEGAGHFWQDDAGPEAVLVIRDWWRNVLAR